MHPHDRDERRAGTVGARERRCVEKPMTMFRRSVLVVVLAGAFLPTTSHAIENCKVKIDQRNGTLLVSAKNVGANPRGGSCRRPASR